MNSTIEGTELSSRFDTTSDETLSFGQYIGLCISCILGCILSIVGSVVILYCSRYKLSKLYHRTLAILSVFDILNSTSWALHPFVFDVKGTEGLYWANGNFDTCAAGGFFSIGKFFSEFKVHLQPLKIYCTMQLRPLKIFELYSALTAHLFVH